MAGIENSVCLQYEQDNNAITMSDKNATNGKRRPLKSKKICPVDGVEFMATYSGMFCTQRCRAAFKRLVERGEKPDFYEMAKGVKNQKIPSLEVKPKKGKKTEVVGQQKQTASNPSTMTKEQIMMHNAGIKRQIEEVRRRKNPASGNPRAHQLAKEQEISDLESKLIH